MINGIPFVLSALLYTFILYLFSIKLACLFRHNEDKINLPGFPNKCADWAAGPQIDGFSEKEGGCTRIVDPLLVNLESEGCYRADHIPFDFKI